MARQVLPIVGAIIGAYFGNPQLGYAIGTIIGNAVDPVQIQGPKIGDVAYQTSSEGVYQPMYFGTSCGAGNVIMQGPNIIRESTDSGKGGPETVSERLYKTFAIRIGVSWQQDQGIAGVSRIWEDEKLVYDVRPESEILEESIEFSSQFTLYLGTRTQLPDPDLEALPAVFGGGIGNVPAYAGRAYIVFPNKDITDRRSIPNYRFEVVANGSSTPATRVMAIRDESSTFYYRTSPDGIDWSAPWIFGGEVGLMTALRASNNRYIGWAYTSSPPAYFEVGGTEWQLSEGDNWTGAKSTGWVDPEGQVLIGFLETFSENSRMAHSFDDATSFDRIEGSPASEIILRLNPYYVSMINNQLSHSFSGVWSAPVAQTETLSGGACGWTTPYGAFIGTSKAGSPLLLQVLTKDTVVVIPIPTLSGATRITAINYGVLNGVTYAVFGTDGGHLCWRSEIDEWYLSDDNFGGIVRGITFNGSYFIAIGDDTETGYIKTSPTGETWTTRVSEPILAEVTRWVDIAALAVSAGEVISEPVLLRDCVARIHQLCGHSSADYDVAGLGDQTVDGLVLAGGFTGAEAIRSLSSAFIFDSPEYDKKIRHTYRGAPVVRTLTFDDLASEPDLETREQAIEYPKKLHLDFQSPITGYAPAKATSQRESQDIRVVGEVSVQTPVVFNDSDFPAQLSNKLHKITWADADGEVQIDLPLFQNVDLVGGECIALFLRDSVFRLRIDQIESADWLLKLKCRHDRQSAYTSNVTGVPLPVPSRPPPSIVGPTISAILDIPALIDSHDISPVIYYGGTGGSEAWYGYVTQVSTEGSEYLEVGRHREATIIGSLVEPITSASSYYTDTTNIVKVSLYRDASIDSLTITQFLSEGGSFALENDDGTWELLQGMEWDQIDERTYHISNLLRGRLNSMSVAHATGSLFVYLPTVQVSTMGSSAIGRDLDFRTTSFGESPENGEVIEITYDAVSQIEFPVADFSADVLSGTISGTIIPRHRFGTEDNPIRSINWVEYLISATDGVSSVTYRTTSDDYSIDVSSLSLPISISISQVNRWTGPGPSVTKEVS